MHYVIKTYIMYFQGVIFSVDYNETLKLICSVSDDRSIRLYKVKFPGDNAGQSLKDWKEMETSLLHVLYGHSARVWDVKLLSTSFVSVGEVILSSLFSSTIRRIGRPIIYCTLQGVSIGITFWLCFYVQVGIPRSTYGNGLKLYTII
jgi:hypothetical protein